MVIKETSIIDQLLFFKAQEDDVASAQKQIKEIEATAIRQAVIALEMPTEAAEYITRSFERFQEELKEISDASIANVRYILFKKKKSIR